MKTEPEAFSIDDLARLGTEPWTGVRSHFAKLHMRAMSVGDPVLFYHSSCEPPGVAGLARVSKIGVVDGTQFDPASKYFDPKATRDKPTWDCVEVAFVEKWANYVPLHALRADPPLADMLLLRRGMRLSVQPVSEAEYARIVAMSAQAWPEPDKPAATRKPRATRKPAAKRKPAATRTPARKRKRAATRKRTSARKRARR